MKYLIALLIGIFAFGQNSYKQAIRNYQDSLSAEFRNPEETPLRGELLTSFKALPFFRINPDYRVTAHFTRIKDAEFFELPTSSGKTKKYREYGKLTFELKGHTYSLTVYQSEALMKIPKYKDFLFLPFRDATNEKTTYGGGRYLDLRIPKGNTVVIDFNKAYNPYCAYNAFDYNCPIVPLENKLPIKIKAGVKYKPIYY